VDETCAILLIEDDGAIRGLLADAFEGRRASLGGSTGRANDRVGALAPRS